MAGNGNYYSAQYGAVPHDQAYSYQQPVQHVYYTGISQYGGYSEPAPASAEMATPAQQAYAYPQGISAYTSSNISAYQTELPVAVANVGIYNQKSSEQQDYSKSYAGSSASINETSSYQAAYQNSYKPQPQQQQHQPRFNKNNWQNRKPQFKQFGQKPRDRPVKAPQLQYCEICKISCAGPQTYLEHLEGKAHKKKELQNKASAPSSVGVTKPVTSMMVTSSKNLKCDLCEIMCSDADTYAAHLKGIKHQKVLELHNKLGKPIPEFAKVPVATAMKEETKPEVPKLMPHFIGPSKPGNNNSEEDSSEVQPIGEEYLDEGMNSTGTTMTYYCKLCACSISDPVAKEAHLRGRRHRTNYKSKVDKTIKVDKKVMPHNRRFQGRNEDFSMRRQVEKLRQEKEMLEKRLNASKDVDAILPRDLFSIPCTSLLHDFMPKTMGPARFDERNDPYVLFKHEEIYPTEEDLQNVQEIVVDVEKSLRIISDQFAEMDTPKVEEDTEKEAENTEADKEASKPKPSKLNLNEVRHLKGVMRTGPLAKGLLLHSDLNVDLLILCDLWPSKQLVRRVATELPNQLVIIAEGKYQVSIAIDASFILVTFVNELPISCRISLTSTAVKQDITPPEDSLPRELCLQLLASLRQTKWFEDQAQPLKNCALTIRVMKDLCIRIPTWHPITHWALELLVERCLYSYNAPLSPAMAIRIILECLSSGFLLPGGPGILDPCEKSPIDVFEQLLVQEREDITNCAQQALRLLALDQIHLMLGIDDIYATDAMDCQEAADTSVPPSTKPNLISPTPTKVSVKTESSAMNTTNENNTTKATSAVSVANEKKPVSSIVTSTAAKTTGSLVTANATKTNSAIATTNAAKISAAAKTVTSSVAQPKPGAATANSTSAKTSTAANTTISKPSQPANKSSVTPQTVASVKPAAIAAKTMVNATKPLATAVVTKPVVSATLNKPAAAAGVLKQVINKPVASSTSIKPTVGAVAKPVIPANSAAKPVIAAANSAAKPNIAAANSAVKPVISAAISAVKPVGMAANSAAKSVISAANSATKPVISAATKPVVPAAKSVATPANPLKKPQTTALAGEPPEKKLKN